MDILCCVALKCTYVPNQNVHQGTISLWLLRVGRRRIRNPPRTLEKFRSTSQTPPLVLGVTPRRQFGCHFLDPDPERVSSLFSCHLPISPVKPIQAPDSINGESCAGTMVQFSSHGCAGSLVREVPLRWNSCRPLPGTALLRAHPFMCVQDSPCPSRCHTSSTQDLVYRRQWCCFIHKGLISQRISQHKQSPLLSYRLPLPTTAHLFTSP